MSISAFAGPVVQFGAASYASNLDYNNDRAPSALDLGMMLLDPRTMYAYQPGNIQQSAGTTPWSGINGFVDGSYIVLDQAPSTLSAVNIAASQSPAAGPIVLVSATGAGITAGVSIVRADTGVLVPNLLAIDGPTRRVPFGGGVLGAWDPTTMVARNVRISSGGTDTGITFTVTGYDVYGFPMTETITGAGAGVASGKKAFKYIASVTHTGSVATTVSVGTGDVYGLPLRVTDFFYLDLFWAGTFITATTGLLVADTNTATATTGDVRGTYAVQTASNGTNKLQCCIMVSPTALGVAFSAATVVGGGYQTGLFGVPQF